MIPNDIFTNILRLCTGRILHSCPANAQRALNEFLPSAILRWELNIMIGLNWDLGDDNTLLKI